MGKVYRKRFLLVILLSRRQQIAMSVYARMGGESSMHQLIGHWILMS